MGFGSVILSEPAMEGPTLNQFQPSGKSRQTAPDQAGIRSLWMVYPIVSPCFSAWRDRSNKAGSVAIFMPCQCRIPSLPPRPTPGPGGVHPKKKSGPDTMAESVVQEQQIVAIRLRFDF